MVQLTIQVRPTRGYTFAKSLKKVNVDSSIRVEDLVTMVRLPKQGTRFFHQGHEMPLNSSLATHNVQDGDILETCSSPLMSSILSTVISDLEAVQKVTPDLRTPANILPLLDNPSLTESADWDTDRWSHEHVKRRSICCKMMKMVLQRQDRFANLQVPPCNDLHELHNYMKQNVFRKDTVGHNTMEHCFKPETRNRNGKPSLVWELLQQKLDQFVRYTATRVEIGEDPIESFLTFQNSRHETDSIPENLPRKRPRTDSPSSSRSRRQLPTPATTCTQDVNCSYCNVDRAHCMCMDDNCPFLKAPSCFGCFRANHPILMRDHERVDLNDSRVKEIMRLRHRQSYCPKYRSGPFAILCTLYEAMHGSTTPTNTVARRQLSLTEKKLKETAQQRCSSNLYDRQARGRSAFAGVELLCDKGLVRKEMIPGEAEENALFSLLPTGEQLAKYCLAFDESMNALLNSNRSVARDRAHALGTLVPSKRPSLIIDTREDKTFASRLEDRCRSLQVEFSRRDLPAGDYLFITNTGPQEDFVLPVVVERKSWSDLADSVMGRGRRRLDCVRVGGNNTVCDRQCQLCRMKQSGCSKIMLFVEGARCLCHNGRNINGKESKQCQYCSELEQRHGPSINQSVLEEVLYQLQVRHSCLVHFTRDYNETINSLLIIREILGGIAPRSSLSYQDFCSNARKRKNVLAYKIPPRGRVLEWSDATFIEKIHSGRMGKSVQQLFSPMSVRDSTAPVVNLNSIFVDLIESDDDNNHDDGGKSVNPKHPIVIVDDVAEWTDSTNEEVIVLDDMHIPQNMEHTTSQRRRQKKDKGGEVQVLESTPATPTIPRENEQTLLLLSGMNEYDTEYHKDIDAIWKRLYSEHNSQEIINFKELCNRHLQQVQVDSTPFVERASRIFWILYVQLRYDVILHPALDKDCVVSIRNLWTSVGNRGKLTSRSESSLPPSSVSQTSPPKECIICRDALGAMNVNALPCGHCFHSCCIQQWFSSRKERKCPVCNFAVGYPKDNEETVARTISVDDTFQPQTATRATRSVTRELSVQASTQSSTSDAIREARLRRFERAGVATIASPPSVQQNSKPAAKRSWNCARCTFENNWNDDVCSMCQAFQHTNRCESPVNRSTSTLLSNPSCVAHTWNCSVCTLENEAQSTTCSACGSMKDPTSFTKEARVTPVTPRVDLPSHRIQSSSSLSGGTKCGACGLFGHNRGTGTALTCPSYNLPEEVELRRKKAEAAMLKAREAAERMEQLQRDEQTANEQLRRAEEAMAALRQTQENRTNTTQSERRRLQKEKERAEKRARQLG